MQGTYYYTYTRSGIAHLCRQQVLDSDLQRKGGSVTAMLLWGIGSGF